VWASVETHLGRMLGFAVIVENGMSLLAIGVGGPEGVLLFFWLTFVRLFSIVLWAAALSYLNQETQGELSFAKLHGVGHIYPLVSIGMVVAQFSLSGIPLLAGFSARLSLWRQLAPAAPVTAVMVLLGSIGLLLGAIRTLNVLFVSLPHLDADRLDSAVGIVGQDGRLISERLLEWSLFGLYVVVLVSLGLLPGVYLPVLERLLLIFNQIGGG